MRPLLLALAAAAALGSSSAEAGLLARIDNARQRMHVYVDQRLAFVWPVSTARRGLRTPAGSYRVQRMEPFWRSRTYAMAPMPHALFFHGGYAIHGTSAVGQLGHPASHGCVRLSPGNARILFGIAQRYGGGQVVVVN